MSASAIFEGAVTHRRLRPRAHRLSYRMFWLLVDLDELQDPACRPRLLSHNRPNLFSIQDRDHGDGKGSSLRLQVEARLVELGLPIGGPIRLVTMPRILGYVFNPLSLFLCHAPDGTLQAVWYEVSNTFGERHSYLFPVSLDRQGGPIRQSCAKRFHVSPFLGMEMDYDFRLALTDEALKLAIQGRDGDGPAIAAAFAGRRRPLTDRALLRLFITYPLLTLKVIGAIHWEALRLWLKGIRLNPHVPAPSAPVTIIALDPDRSAP